MDRLDPDAIAQLLRAVFGTSPDAIAITRRGTIHVANSAFLELFGYAEEAELTGTSILDLIAPRCQETIAAFIQRDSAGDTRHAPYVTTGLRRDGAEITLQTHTTTYELGGETYTLAFLREVRDDGASPAALRQSEDFYRAIFEGNTAVKLLICPTTGCIIDANPAAASFYGWPLDELRRMRIMDINTLSADEVKAEMEAARTGRRGYFRFLHRTARGIRHVEIHSGPVEIAGRQLLLSILHDVTERDRLAEQLARAHKLESVGRLAGGIAHDFNNLLTVMLTSASSLRRKLPADSPLAPSIEDLGHAVQRAANLTQDLLAFGGTQDLRPTPLDLSEHVARIARLLEGAIETDDIAIRTELTVDLPRVFLDASQLEQAVMNLGLNARDAMPEGGTLTLRTRLHHVRTGEDFVAPGAWVTLAVGDTGCGMDEATRTRVFEPFFSTKPTGRGTGLGLARVYGIVSQSGGRITLTSRRGEGSLFTLYFPVMEEPFPPPRPDRAPPPRAASGPRTVLLVEDVASVRRVMASALENAGFRVLHAGSAEEALQPARALGAVDVLVTDVVMPGRSGVELARELLAERPELRVLLVSGHAGDHVPNELPDHVRFVRKPFVASTLVEAVRALLDGGDDR